MCFSCVLFYFDAASDLRAYIKISSFSDVSLSAVTAPVAYRFHDIP